MTICIFFHLFICPSAVRLVGALTFDPLWMSGWLQFHPLFVQASAFSDAALRTQDHLGYKNSGVQRHLLMVQCKVTKRAQPALLTVLINPRLVKTLPAKNAQRDEGSFWSSPNELAGSWWRTNTRLAFCQGRAKKTQEVDIPVVGSPPPLSPTLNSTLTPMWGASARYSHSAHSAISAPSTISVWMIPSRLLPLLTAFTQQLWSPSVKCVSVPSSTNSPCRCKAGVAGRTLAVPFEAPSYRCLFSWVVLLKLKCC